MAGDARPPDQPDVTTAYPLPPSFYRKYTDENVAGFPKYQRNKLDTEKSNDPYSLAIKGARSKAKVPELPTPAELTTSEPLYLHLPLPIEGTYYTFGAAHTTEIGIKPLKDQGEQQLYSDEQRRDWKATFKHLALTLALNLKDLVHVAATRLEHSDYKLEQVRVVLLNLHHLINEYREHQARDMLILLQQKQVDKRRRTAQEIRTYCEKMRTELSDAKRDIVHPPSLTPERDTNGISSSSPDTPQWQKPVPNIFAHYQRTQDRLLAIADSIQ
ncbi:MED7 protein-domain-containing protein [Phlyctochytrium arcticum]|nr:MED7 protein-domain-containing protein [Phlyctochytrium arcticum]